MRERERDENTPSPYCHHISAPTIAILTHQNKYLYKLEKGQTQLLEHAMSYLDPSSLPLLQPAP